MALALWSRDELEEAPAEDPIRLYSDKLLRAVSQNDPRKSDERWEWWWLRVRDQHKFPRHVVLQPFRP